MSQKRIEPILGYLVKAKTPTVGKVCAELT